MCSVVLRTGDVSSIKGLEGTGGAAGARASSGIRTGRNNTCVRRQMFSTIELGVEWITHWSQSAN